MTRFTHTFYSLGGASFISLFRDTQDYNENRPKPVLAFLGAEAEDIGV